MFLYNSNNIFLEYQKRVKKVLFQIKVRLLQSKIYFRQIIHLRIIF